LAANAAELERRLREIEPVAVAILSDPALLWRIGEAVARRGVIGERANALLLYLAVASQVTSAPISIVVKGDSSGGKTFLVLQVLALFPNTCHIDITSMSEKALIYDERNYANKTVVVFEVHGQGGELANYLIRTLISEGCIRHQTVEQTAQGLVGREIVKQGPTNFITTTTFPELHAENETRVWSILVDDSPDTTRRVLEVQAQIASGAFEPADDDRLRLAFEWLTTAGAKEAVVPFAELLPEHMPNQPLRLRRDFPRLLSLIRMCAILHQKQRERDNEGRVLATLADYAMVRELVAAIFERGVLGLIEKTTDLVKALERVLATRGGQDLSASYSDLVKETGKPKCYISRWLKPALQVGLVDNTNAGKQGHPAALKLGHYQLGRCEGLPVVQSLAQKFRTQVEWINPLTGEVLRTGCNTTSADGASSEILNSQEDKIGQSSANGGVAVLQSQEEDQFPPPL
jgi:hypothetical protein